MLTVYLDPDRQRVARFLVRSVVLEFAAQRALDERQAAQLEHLVAQAIVLEALELADERGLGTPQGRAYWTERVVRCSEFVAGEL